MSTPIIALDIEKVAKLTGLSVRTLIDWEKKGIFEPSYVDPVEGSPYRRIYSFRDVVSLRALYIIRRDLKVPLSEIKRAAEYLRQFSESPWASLKLGVVYRKLVFRNPDTGSWEGVAGQTLLQLTLPDIPREVSASLSTVMERDKESIGQITRNRNVMHNRPVIADTRIPTSTIWNFHKHGYSSTDIVREYPQLTHEDVEAAIQFELNELSKAKTVKIA